MTDLPEARTDQATATRNAARWLARFTDAVNANDAGGAVAFFVEDGFWRDLLAFTWNIVTLEGRPAIADMLAAQLGHVQACRFTLDGNAKAEGEITTALFTFETGSARGRGILRLRGGLCWTLLTSMTELIGHEEKTGARRALGTVHEARKDRETWTQARQKEQTELGYSTQPDCLIIGGGQGGIALGARLRKLGVPTIIVEKNDRPGDSWRNRYKSLCLHDPVWYDHMPYLPFPDDWPVFTPKDKMGDWLEAYASIMELNFWGSTEATSAAFDPGTATWTVHVTSNGVDHVLRPRMLVFATGAYGFARWIDFAGADDFQGEMFHTSTYHSGEAYRGKRCAVIGSGSSAHDICVDLWECGAEVTMIQRASSIVVRSDTLMEYGFRGLYSEEAVASGMTTDKADLLVASLPFRLIPDTQRPIYQKIADVDAEFYRRLTDAGFLWDFGPDGSGLMSKAMRTASGYYIDVGASELIASGEITMASGSGIARIEADGLTLEDGRKVEADVIVQATGYGSMDDMVAQLISPEVAARVGRFWGYGSGVPGDPGPWEGELRNMWKPTAHEALWFHGGNLALSRFHSRHVALQIKARMEGIATPVYASQ